MRTRREVLKFGLLAGFGVSGCAPTYDRFHNLISAPAVSKDAYGGSAEQIAAMPYAAMGVDVGDARFQTILATADQGRLVWASADQLLFTTSGGRLVATQGLERDLLDTRWLRPDPLLQIAAGGTLPPRGVYREVDLGAGKKLEKGLPVESEFELAGEETLQILGRPHQTIKIRETARVRPWRWEAQQVFWVDRSEPVVWFSRQRYCPEVETIGLEILKKPAV